MLSETIVEEVTERSMRKSDLTNVEETVKEDNEIEPRYLSESGLLLYIKPEDKPFPTVPPPTPKELISDCYVTILPKLPDSLTDIEIPHVRECGIRDSIGILAKYFNCENYRHNLVQFWFLDMLVDCIWRAQDEFSFSNREQKVMLEWILFVMKLIKSNNMTKSLMFEVFNEALLLAEDYVQSGGPQSPTPNTLFTLKLEGDVEEENIFGSIFQSFDNFTTKSSEEFKLKPPKQFIVLKFQNDIQIFKVPNTEISPEDCLSSSIDPPSENEFQIGEPTESVTPEIIASDSSVEYCKPDISTPSRFKSLQDLEAPNQDSENTVQKNEEDHSKTFREWVNIPREQATLKCPSHIVTKKIETTPLVSPTTVSLSKGKDQESFIETRPKKSEKSLVEEVLDNEKIFQIYYDYNMWQLKNEYMADPNIGWSPSLTSYKNIFKANKEGKDLKNRSTLKILGMEHETLLKGREDNKFINLCVLMAVKQIVFDYFEYNFSFELVRISLKHPQYLITQDINTNWNIPKEIRGDFKKPVPKKPKKEKIKKEKIPKVKKDGTSKKSKSTKGSKGKGKDKKTKDKKSDKKSKSSKKGQKEKKLSKEEKREMDRLRKEQEEIERAQLKEEENKRFMFPLKEAVDENFFTNIFPDYKAKKGGKKEDKSSKSSKSDKLSAKGKKKKKK